VKLKIEGFLWCEFVEVNLMAVNWSIGSFPTYVGFSVNRKRIGIEPFGDENVYFLSYIALCHSSMVFYNNNIT